jgi:hypothetical protein
MTDIPGVISLMARTQDVLSEDEADGLGWFNLLYMMVTEEIYEHCKRKQWRSPHWLVHLDVDFARLYFEGILACLAGRPDAPKAWRALMDRRYAPGIANVQFAVLGMNAHINRDLMLAVVSAYERTYSCAGPGPTWSGAEYSDFRRINDILDLVEISAMQRMATGVLKEIVRVMRGWDRRIAMGLVGTARDAAFANAMICWRLRGEPRHLTRFVRAADRLASGAARSFAVPTEHAALAHVRRFVGRSWRGAQPGTA